MNRFVALLRGINVGGKNLIKMADLKACFEALGFENVSTYIQSGNVLFNADKPDRATLESRIEEALSKTFNYESRVVVRSHKQMKEIVARAPEGFGDHPGTYRYDVIFLKAPLTAAQAMMSAPSRCSACMDGGGDTLCPFSNSYRRIFGPSFTSQLSLRSGPPST